MAHTIVGQPVPRVDALEKVTGAARYIADLRLAGVLVGRVLRSPYAHARILSVDTSAVAQLPGVVVVIGSDLVAMGGESLQDMPFLALDRVRYVGEPVAAVAASDEETAEEALGLIRVEYQELPGVFDVLAAAHRGAPLVHEELGAYSHAEGVNPLPGTNILSITEVRQGDVGRGFAEADHVFEDTFKIHAVQHGQVEPHCAIAQWGPEGKVTIWTANDAPHRLRKEIADALRLPLGQVRVIVPYLGGGFGGKGGLKLEPVAVALALKARHRPVKVISTREEMFSATLVRHAAVITVKTGVKADGAMVARDVVGYWDTGAYAEKGPTVVKQGTLNSAGPYRIPHLHLVGYCVYTNHVIAGAWRGYGVSQVTWASESQMDMIARRLGLDPLEFRLKNILREGDRLPTGQVATSIGVEECLRRVAAELRWGEQTGPDCGKGLACTIKNTKTPSGSAAYVTLNQDGTAHLLTSTVEIGQGARTILAQIVAEELGIPLERVSVAQPDTDVTPYDTSTTASRSAFHMGNAVRMAGQDVVSQLIALAASLLECSPEDLHAVDGKVSRRSDPARALTYQELLHRCYGAGGSVLGRGFYYPAMTKGSIFWMYGAHGAEVAVDRQTGQVEVKRLVAAHDVGKALNPANVNGQIEGGVLMGMGTTLFEEIVMQNGRVLNANLHDYKMPTTMDMPEIVPLIVEAPHPEGPYGAKGMGEPVNCPTAPAIANAVEDAIGVRIQELPLSPERVLHAIRRARAGAPPKN